PGRQFEVEVGHLEVDVDVLHLRQVALRRRHLVFARGQADLDVFTVLLRLRLDVTVRLVVVQQDLRAVYRVALRVEDLAFDLPRLRERWGGERDQARGQGTNHERPAYGGARHGGSLQKQMNGTADLGIRHGQVYTERRVTLVMRYSRTGPRLAARELIARRA